MLDGSGELPPGWAWAELDEFVRERTATVDPAREPDAAFTLYSVPSHATGKPERTMGRGIGSTKLAVKPGTVLLCKINPRINRVWVVADAAAPDTRPIASTEWITFPPHEAVLPGYLRLFLMREAVRVHMAANASGVGGSLMRANAKVAAALRMPLAPLPEQARIVTEVEALYKELDEAETGLGRARDALADYRASLLHAACTGALTAAWRAANPRPVENGPALLRRILTERRAAWERAELARLATRGKPAPKGDAWKMRYEEPQTPDTDGLPALPDGWVWTSIGQLFRVMIGATPSRAVPGYWGGDIAWVSSGEVAFCTIKDTRERITAAGLANSSTRLHPPGTVLLAMIGEGKTRGQAAILATSACNSQNSAAIRVSETPIPPDYVYAWLTLVYQQSRKASAGGNQSALNKEKVQGIMMPLPPLAEIEAITEQLSGEIDSTADVGPLLDGTADQTAALRQSILHTAFTGRLVPQDPADQPAAALLAQLRAAPTVPGRAPRRARPVQDALP